ncbi:MAG: hypothetical protein JWN11_2234 [Hyphomicrobiales bacterium]|nr:hypothetical protein [Hyphomicrobiales bacterium]
MNDKRWPVLVHLNATSLIDEGTDTVFDIVQQKVDPTGVLMAAHGFNPEIIDRGRTWPGHGPKGSHGGLGGYYAEAHDHFYRHTGLGSPHVTESPFAEFDAMAVGAKAAAERGLELHVYILESAGTGGFQRNVTNWPTVLEVDVDGRRGKLPCVNHPSYRAWKLALLEDLYTSYEFKGLLWGVERWGPLHQIIAGEQPACFCEHCRGVATAAGLDWLRVRRGYAALRDSVAAARADAGKPGALLRVLLEYPEVLGWEARWTEAYLSLHRELYGAAKWLQPERSFGLGLWHYYFINPLLQAEWNMADFSAASDYIRPILYHLPEGPRIKRYLGLLSTAFGGMREETIWAFFAEMLGLDLPKPAAFASAGLPADYVAQGVNIVRRNGGTRVIAGIGVDVFENGLAGAMTPEDTEAAIEAAWKAQADGITIARNYAEMQHANLDAAGRAIKAIRASR